MPPEQRDYTNNELAAVFERIANLLEIQGEVIFKIRAYQRAAESLRAEAEDVHTLRAEKRLANVPGIGKAIAEKIEELLSTGKLRFLEKLEQEIPTSLLDMLQIPDVGPKRAALFWKEAGITTLAQLEAAARENKLQSLPGLGAKSEARILAGIEALARRSDRMSLEVAWSHANRWLEWLRAQPEVQRAEAGGSLRRWRETIGDLDLIAATNDSVPLFERFTTHPDVVRIKGQGEYKSSVELRSGLNIQLWTQPPERFGSLWVYATGSKAHNVRLRELALKKNLSLSERGFEDKAGALTVCGSEEDVYAALGLPLIASEMREDRGEIEAALKKNLPDLITVDDLQASLHNHTTFSDGALSVAEIAQIAMNGGYKTLAITDHSDTLGIVQGMSVARLHQQRAEIEQVQARLGDKLTLLQGVEVDIMADGSLGYPDEVLAELDLVIAALHISLRQPRETITKRLLNAIRNPHVDIIAHPSGRLLPNREGADLDWEVVLDEARKSGVALEINASPYRLDLTDVYARRAVELGIPLTINTDAHSPADFDLMPFGISVARRAWVQPENVINTWPFDKLESWLKSRK